MSNVKVTNSMTSTAYTITNSGTTDLGSTNNYRYINGTFILPPTTILTYTTNGIQDVTNVGTAVVSAVQSHYQWYNVTSAVVNSNYVVDLGVYHSYWGMKCDDYKSTLVSNTLTNKTLLPSIDPTEIVRQYTPCNLSITNLHKSRIYYLFQVGDEKTIELPGCTWMSNETWKIIITKVSYTSFSIYAYNINNQIKGGCNVTLTGGSSTYCDTYIQVHYAGSILLLTWYHENPNSSSVDETNTYCLNLFDSYSSGNILLSQPGTNFSTYSFSLIPGYSYNATIVPPVICLAKIKTSTDNNNILSYATLGWEGINFNMSDYSTYELSTSVSGNKWYSVEGYEQSPFLIKGTIENYDDEFEYKYYYYDLYLNRINQWIYDTPFMGSESGSFYGIDNNVLTMSPKISRIVSVGLPKMQSNKWYWINTSTTPTAGFLLAQNSQDNNYIDKSSIGLLSDGSIIRQVYNFIPRENLIVNQYIFPLEAPMYVDTTVNRHYNSSTNNTTYLGTYYRENVDTGPGSVTQSGVFALTGIQSRTLTYQYPPIYTTGSTYYSFLLSLKESLLTYWYMPSSSQTITYNFTLPALGGIRVINASLRRDDLNNSSYNILLDVYNSNDYITIKNDTVTTPAISYDYLYLEFYTTVDYNLTSENRSKYYRWAISELALARDPSKVFYYMPYIYSRDAT